MKLITSLALLVLVSCNAKIGQDEGPTNPGVEHQVYEPLVVAPEEVSRIQEICSALQSKEDLLPFLINTQYTFSYSQRGCSEETSSVPADVKVKLQRPDSSYIFKKENGEAFDFANVETLTSGSMSAICSGMVDPKSPMQTSSTGAVWFTTFTRTNICSSDFNSICIHLKRGEYVSGKTYAIHTDEWIKFRIMNENRGFFVERKIVSSLGCPAGKTFEKTAILK